MDSLIKLITAASIIGGVGGVGLGTRITPNNPSSTIGTMILAALGPAYNRNDPTVLISANGREIEYLYQPISGVVGFSR